MNWLKQHYHIVQNIRGTKLSQLHRFIGIRRKILQLYPVTNINCIGQHTIHRKKFAD